MSHESLKKFVELVENSDELQADIRSKGGEHGIRIRDFVELGARHGCEFSSQEAVDMITAVANLADAPNAELTEDQLAAVAGGASNLNLLQRFAYHHNLAPHLLSQGDVGVLNFDTRIK